jgi:sugar O-acyltransferase (sialic acid O-acetyltransferase NeuD family)
MMLDTFKYVLVGASGHAKVVLDILERSGNKVIGLIELNPSIDNLFGYPVFKENEFTFLKEHRVIVAVGSNKQRLLITGNLNVVYGVALHPTASIASHVSLGLGSMVMAKSVVNSNAIIGKHSIINSASIIEHDCCIGDYCHISPGVILCGGVSVGEGTQVGAGAIVLPGLKIGSWSVIGAGTVVTKNVPSECVVMGNPGRVINR